MMIMRKFLLVLLAVSILYNTPLLSQHQSRGDEVPVLKEISGMQEVKKVMPTASELVQVNEVWHKIVDKSKVTIGYCMSSKPYSDGIKGYHGTTPVIVILDKEKKIKKVTILSHYETQSYIEMLKHQKFFASWEGLTVREAMNIKATPDSYSGATVTAVAIRRNLDILLRKAYEKRI